MLENDQLFGKKVVTDPGDSPEFKAGQIITARRLRDENSILKRKDKKCIESRDAVPATANPILQGITRASYANQQLDFCSFIPGNYQST